MSSQKFIGTIDGMKIIEDNNIQSTLLYPTSKKDGNKLGKRKKRMVVYNSYSINGAIFCHPIVIKELLKREG